MATYLSLRSFKMRLEKLSDRDPYSVVCPEGKTFEMTEKFLRVLRARNMSEIADITEREIAEMVNRGFDLAQVIDSDNILSEKKHFMPRLGSMKSVIRKRVL